jgi:hypothetical protein
VGVDLHPHPLDAIALELVELEKTKMQMPRGVQLLV